MKKIKILIVFAVILAVIVSIYAATRQKKEYYIEEIKEYKYHILYKQEKMGVIDEKGNIIIEPIYQYIQIPNPEKPVFICMEEDKNKVLNEKNEEILNEFSNVSAISLQGAKSEVPYEKNILKYEKDGKFGIINFDGEVIAHAKYDKIESLPYKEGELLVEKDGKVGVLNSKGAKIVEIKYDTIEGDNFYKDGTYKESGYIVSNKTNDGYLYGYKNYEGKEVLNTEYNQITRIIDNTKISDVFLIARKNGQVGLIKNGKTVIDFKFQNIEYDVSEDLLVLQKGEKYGVYTLDGREIIKPEYDEISFRGLYIFASNGDEETYFDVNGVKIDKPMYRSIEKTENSKYYITINNENLCGIMEEESKILVENSYAYLEYLFDNYFIASKDGTKFGIINSENKIVVNFEYDILSKIGSGKIIQAKKTNENILDIYSKEIKKVCSRENANIYVYEEYIQIQTQDTNEYFDLEGRNISNSDIYFENKLIASVENGKWGFKNRQGKTEVENEYDEVTELNKYGFAGIKKDGKWGVIDSNKNIIIEPTYEIDSTYVKPEFIGKYFKQYYDTGEVYYTDEVL